MSLDKIAHIGIISKLDDLIVSDFVRIVSKF